jgi:cell division protein DivIC
MKFLDRFRFLKNFYIYTSLAVLVWVLVMDVNSVSTQFENAIKISNLKKERIYYLEAIEKLKKESKEALGDEKRLEKFAREKYYMRKPTEDVYVLVNEKGEAVEK